jgi:CRISPR/Cas system CSM-associated protein Csm2 small subunit
MEAQILIAHENLNFVEIERKRMEQILNVLALNPANNSDFTNQLELTTIQINKLITYENKTVKEATAETEEAVKEINKIQVRLDKRINERDEAY